jgi:hypothetical protein
VLINLATLCAGVRAGYGNGCMLFLPDWLVTDARGPNTGPASKEERFQEEAEALRKNTPADRQLKKAERARRRAEARARAKAAQDGGRVALAPLEQVDRDGHDDDVDEADRSPSPVARPPPVVDPAYLGMKPEQGLIGSAGGKDGGRRSLRGTAGRGSPGDSSPSPAGRGPTDWSLDEQEALVLRLLSKR